MTNHVNTPITDVWASPRKDENYGPPLSNVFVPSGASQKMNLGTAEGEACYYDIKLKYRNGNTQEISNIDLCALNNLTVDVRNGHFVYTTSR